MKVDLKSSVPALGVGVVALMLFQVYSYQNERMVGVASTEGEIEITATQKANEEFLIANSMPIAMVSTRANNEIPVNLDDAIFDVPLSEAQVRAEKAKSELVPNTAKKATSWESIPSFSVSAISHIGGHAYAIVNGLSVHAGMKLDSKFGVIFVRSIGTNFVLLELNGETKSFEVAK
ncbi:TPA: hypothetical protein ACSP3E_003247 [Aeromonas veronii]